MNTVYAMSEEEAAAERTRLQLLADLHRSRRPESYSAQDGAIDAGASLAVTAAQIIAMTSDVYGITELAAADLLVSMDFVKAREGLAA